MAGSIPNVEEGRILTNYVRNPIFLRLYSNDTTPADTFTLAAFTEVAGGGYAFKELVSATWVISTGDPSSAEYPEQEFDFTGTTTAPGTIYGWYYVDSVTGLYIGGERFASGITPLTPVAGSKIKITPIVQAS